MPTAAQSRRTRRFLPSPMVRSSQHGWLELLMRGAGSRSGRLGVNGIIIPAHSSAPITSSTASTSAGAIEILKFHISKNLNRSLEELKKNGYWTYALDMKGKLITKDFKFDKKTILILGNEGKGIRKNIINNSDFIISLPQEEVSGIDSYNAANSLAMTLFHYKVNLL